MSSSSFDQSFVESVWGSEMKRKIGLALTLTSALGLALALSSCEEKLAYYNTYPQGKNRKMDEEVTIKVLIEASTLNIVWVIDNSGSMDDYQRAVIQNTANFLDLFAARKLDWKMGLLSTDPGDRPYIGFDAGDPLNSTMPDAVDKFKAAVARLGTNGTGTEETLAPLVHNLQNYPNFIRHGATTALIFVTDAEEQSDYNDWLKEFRTVVPYSDTVYGYGVFASVESGCSTSEGSWYFTGSPYETFFKGLTGYKTFKICQDFGQSLSEIGQDLVKRAFYSVSIPFRPKPKSIVVDYKGTILKPGPKEEGGYWYYDFDRNAVMLYSLDFAAENDSIHVYAEEDNGVEN